MNRLTFSSLILCLMTVADLSGQSPAPTQKPLTPIKALLNSDGTVRLDGAFRGGVDIRGWSMTTAGNGAPRFLPERAQADPADSAWSARFGLNGMDKDVYALAVDGSILYAGGWFTSAQNVNAIYIAKWDGVEWSALGSGMNDIVFSLVVDGSYLYAGGWFTTAGGVSASHIARWDGSNWSALGTGMNNSVDCLVMMGADLYAGGSFTTAGGIVVDGIAKWNGAVWDSLGSGVSGTFPSVVRMAVIGPDLYAGGRFTQAGGDSAMNIAKWDGSSWSALGSGVSDVVTSLTVDDTDLYVGGWFLTAGGVSADRIAKWDGSTWSALGSGLGGGGFSVPIPVTGVIIGNDLYVAGQFTTAGGLTVNHIAKWDGSSWDSLRSGTNENISALAAMGSDIVLGGSFNTAGGSEIPYLARWDGADYSAVVDPANTHGIMSESIGRVLALVVDGTDLYAGGMFASAGGVNANNIAKWDGSFWSPLGSGISGGIIAGVRALALIGSDLYAGGDFTVAGSTGANNIAKWDGSTWSALGSGVSGGSGGVYALAVIGTDLYAGGYFSLAGGSAANCIAKWNGSVWTALGSGMSGVGIPGVSALATMGTDLFAGGGFVSAGGVTVNNIAKWNGTNWSALGTGIDEFVISLAVNGTDLYAGGNINTAGGVSVGKIAKWNGTSWSALGLGLGGSSWAAQVLRVSGDYLYVGGDFSTAGGAGANNIARWNGTAWTPLGSGTGGTFPGVYALAPDDSGVYAGGIFSTAGGKVSIHIGHWKAEPQGFFSVSPASKSFGDVVVNATKTDTLTVTNTGLGPLVLESVISTNGLFTVLPASATLAASDSLKFSVSFTPTSTGLKSGGIIFHHIGIAPPDTVTVQGTAVMSQFSVTPTGLSFGNVLAGMTKTDSVTVKNPGTAALIITSVYSTDPELTVVPGVATIAPSDSQKFGLTLGPIASYLMKVDTVSFFHNAAGSPTSIVCTATGLLPDTVRESWNMLSVPLIPTDFRKIAVYPEASSPAYAYVGTYEERDTLRNGMGYWVQYDTMQLVEYSGVPITVDTIELRNSWNMVGSISTPVPVAAIVSDPPGIVTTEFFGYEWGYVTATTIEPGKAYWVKSSGVGKLILSSGAVNTPSNRIRIVPTSEPPPSPPGNSETAGHGDVPARYALEQNYPNPFNPVTTISYLLPSRGYVKLSVFDLLGREVATLVDGVQEPGYKKVSFDAGALPSGMYTYRMTAGAFTDVKKMLVMK